MGHQVGPTARCFQENLYVLHGTIMYPSHLHPPWASCNIVGPTSIEIIEFRRNRTQLYLCFLLVVCGTTSVVLLPQESKLAFIKRKMQHIHKAWNQYPYFIRIQKLQCQKIKAEHPKFVKFGYNFKPKRKRRS